MGPPPSGGGSFSKVIGFSKEPPLRGGSTPKTRGIPLKMGSFLTPMPKWGSECIYSEFLTKNDAFLKKSAFFSKKHTKFIVNHTIFGFLTKNECVYSEKSKKNANSIENPFKMSGNTVKTNKKEKIKQN